MLSTGFRRSGAACAALLPLLLAACSGNGSTGPDEDATPVITITGVEQGGTYDAPVTITIAVEPGTYSATLNGSAFVSGGTVSDPGAYTLVVNGRNGAATSRATVAFEIEAPVGGASDVLIVRLLDLREGSFGAPGDAILLTDSSAAGVTHALIDAGARNDVQSYVRNRLTELDVDTLEFMQLTHAHFDHYAGMDEILSGPTHVRTFIYNGQNRSGTSSYVALLDIAEVQADAVSALTAQHTLELGGGPVPTMVTMIPPLTTYLGDANANGDELNEGSLGTLIEHAGFRMYFTGDGEYEANDRWRLSFAGLTGDVDVLKVGHHGANNATASLWLAHTDPATAVISANGTSHPRIGALDRIEAVTTDIYCTNVVGEIRITADDVGGYTVTVENPVTPACAPGSEADS